MSTTCWGKYEKCNFRKICSGGFINYLERFMNRLERQVQEQGLGRIVCGDDLLGTCGIEVLGTEKQIFIKCSLNFKNLTKTVVSASISFPRQLQIPNKPKTGPAPLLYNVLKRTQSFIYSLFISSLRFYFKLCWVDAYCWIFPSILRVYVLVNPQIQTWSFRQRSERSLKIYEKKTKVLFTPGSYVLFPTRQDILRLFCSNICMSAALPISSDTLIKNVFIVTK